MTSTSLKVTPDWVGEIVHDFPAGEWRRVQRAEGYRAIMVNGQITFDEGKCTGATPGKLLASWPWLGDRKSVAGLTIG